MQLLKSRGKLKVSITCVTPSALTRPERGGEMERKKGRAEKKRGGSDVEGRETGQSSAPKRKDQLAPSASVATAHGLKQLVGKKPAKRTRVGQKSAARSAHIYGGYMRSNGCWVQ